MELQQMSIKKAGEGKWNVFVLFSDANGTHKKPFRNVTKTQAKAHVAKAFNTTMEVTAVETVNTP